MRDYINARTVTLVMSALLAPSALRAGDLNPPAGPIGPTMKPLDHLEPRIAVNDANTPGNGSSLFQITQPGSYYLTANVQGTAGKSGIEIASGNVTLDLMGFHVIGAAQTFDGVRVTAGVRDVVVRNGTVRGWGSDGIDLSNCVGVIVCDVIVEENGARGIRAANQARVSGCIARSNGNIGIVVNEGGIVIDCEAADNGSHSISALLQTIIERCFAFRNTGDGIHAANRCVIRHNLCDGNGSGAGVGAGIHVTANLCRIERNHVTGNDRGIDVDAGNNLIIGNSAGGNAANYDIAAGNASGPIVTGANIATNTNPHANYGL
ncbi:MAG: right-handed parallel beta-helix repeat-containing protein [Phycisphaerae bacterium]|nr:right-handed parallel beta-helix repeat-containing protein [Phycisphaerae bacterium]NUQ47217.1 right-handed parallel beta-helix repeat-containing protein [Phycisphaerae bacterium]